jgi:hypothetical protein
VGVGELRKPCVRKPRVLTGRSGNQVARGGREVRRDRTGGRRSGTRGGQEGRGRKKFHVLAKKKKKKKKKRCEFF